MYDEPTKRSLRNFPYGGYDPFHSQPVSHQPELTEYSPPRPPTNATPITPFPSGNYAPPPLSPLYPPQSPYAAYPMLPAPPPYAGPPQGYPSKKQGFGASKNNNPYNQSNSFPFGNSSFPQGFPFNQGINATNPQNQGQNQSPFSWGKTFNGINSAMGFMQQLGSVVSLFK
ncbi:hypothetical protein A374_04484 [Fictibacillus macauensis ZFHKF-1]|uniref:Uncharacterized protein n=1 Tax=Fictibacillus macauensis ZFHKF-1 TaxID=1196324 RepID=I8J4T4_9BACL|nr:hypothetical protein [Fictibacillus macauensis]EIT86801.1 hypothetical protein A374_04484 [Fictibacillus macauensis ZFHKF-1]